MFAKTSICRRLVAGAGALAMMAGLVVVTPSATLAASCYRSSCQGLSPISAGCISDQVLVSRGMIRNTSGGAVVGYIDLMHSNACGAAWARVYNATSGYPLYWEADVDNIDSGRYSHWRVYIPSGWYGYSVMVGILVNPQRAFASGEGYSSSSYGWMVAYGYSATVWLR
jgi:Protein of unknown function (DUF2690)